MALTVKRAGSAEFGNFIKQLVLGDPGAGKTRTASTWPDVIYANCEGGMMSVADRQPATVDVHSQQQMKELINALRQPPSVREGILGLPTQTVCIDTFDEYAKILIRERLEAERRDAMAIQDWGWLGAELANTVRAFRNLEMNVIFNVHLKSQEDSETGRTFFKPNIAGAMGDDLPAYFDMVFVLVARPVVQSVGGQNVRSIVRYMQTYPDAQHGWVKDRSGQLPMEFPINFDDDYDRLSKLMLWNQNTVAAEPVIVTEVPTLEPEAAPAVPKEPDVPGQASLTAVAEAPGAPAEAPEAPKKAPEPIPTPEIASTPETAPETPETPAPEPLLPSDADQAAAIAYLDDYPDGPDAERATQIMNTPVDTPADAPAPEAVDETIPPAGTVDEPTIPTTVEQPATDLEEWQVCQGCGGTVESKDQADLSYIRHKEHLCRACFAARRKGR